MDRVELTPGRTVWACDLEVWGPEECTVVCECEFNRVVVRRPDGSNVAVWMFECWPTEYAGFSGALNKADHAIDMAREHLDVARRVRERIAAAWKASEADRVAVRIAGEGVSVLADLPAGALALPPVDPEAVDYGTDPHATAPATDGRTLDVRG